MANIVCDMESLTSEADLVERAAKAQARDWSVAAKLTAELRARFPNSQAGYQIGASAARTLRLFDEASAILAEAAGRFADQAWVTAEQAALAQARGAAEQTRQLAADLRSRFPQHVFGFHLGASAARDLRLFDEAFAILSEADRRFADQAWVVAEQAALAQARGDAEQARRLAADLRKRFPQHVSGYQIGASGARALRLFDEAAAILAEAAERFTGQAWVIGEQAALAQASGDTEQARQLSHELRGRFPQDVSGFHLGASAARDLRLFDEADEILTEAAHRFGDQVWVTAEKAALAQGRGDAEAARRLAADLRTRFPQHVSGYQIGASAARTVRLFEEATAVLREATERFAGQAWVVAEQAALAQARSETGQACQLAADLRNRYPQHMSGYQIGASGARALRLFDEAAAILAEATESFAGQAWLVAEQAALAQARGDAEQARRLAADLRTRFPQHVSGYQIGASGARALRLFDEATAILTKATERFADQPWVAAEQVSLSQARGDPEQARRLSADLRNRFPEHVSGYQIGVSAARDLRLFDEATEILTEATVRFAEQAWMAAEKAWLAHARGNAEDAIQILAALRSREPANPTGYSTAVSLLRSLNRVTEAEAILEEARPRFSSEAWFERQSAETSSLSNLARNRAHAERLLKALTAERCDWPVLARDHAQRSGKIVVVIGMHRAGTSLCTKIVSRLGFSLGGPLLGPHFDNPDGYQEHAEIFQSHQALLSHLGAAWDTSWSVRPCIRQSLHSAEVRLILDRLKSIVLKELSASSGRWAFKDPRTACLLPAWTCIFEELGIEPLWLLAVRDPRAVAASLYARNRLPPAVGELLWVEHYLNALRHLGPRIAGFIHYEKWFSPEHDQLNTLADILGAVSLSEIERAAASISQSLRHEKPQPGEAMLKITRDVYSWLCSDSLPLGILQERAELVWQSLGERAQESETDTPGPGADLAGGDISPARRASGSRRKKPRST